MRGRAPWFKVDFHPAATNGDTRRMTSFMAGDLSIFCAARRGKVNMAVLLVACLIVREGTPRQLGLYLRNKKRPPLGRRGNQILRLPAHFVALLVSRPGQFHNPLRIVKRLFIVLPLFLHLEKTSVGIGSSSPILIVEAISTLRP